MSLSTNLFNTFRRFGTFVCSHQAEPPRLSLLPYEANWLSVEYKAVGILVGRIENQKVLNLTKVEPIISE
jgi:hypothetical protein